MIVLLHGPTRRTRSEAIPLLPAQQLAARGFRGSPLKASLHGWTAFLKAYVYRAGFLTERPDGCCPIQSSLRRCEVAAAANIHGSTCGRVCLGTFGVERYVVARTYNRYSPLDWVRALSSWKYAKLTASIY